ncbi:hypothetical protein G7054_g5579 [Neopestalotiopsis clavispora]|nr:hypothetical protein G7054_g5579 [Neopestalotiopsis clavispora]
MSTLRGAATEFMPEGDSSVMVGTPALTTVSEPVPRSAPVPEAGPSPSGSLPEQGNPEVAEKSPIQSHYHQTGGNLVACGTSGYCQATGGMGLSAGSDPISEGRRIYIGNLKYTVTRSQVKHLLREFGVYNTVEKIYMPYAEGTQEVSFDQHDYLADGGYDGRGYNGQEEPIELPNKGYVFVTYGNPAEAEAAINRLGGIYHLDRKLVCRPGLPKGVAFRQDDLNGGASRWKRNRRWNRYDSIFNEQQRSGQYFGANNALTHNGTYNAIYGNANAYNGGDRHGPYHQGNSMGPAAGSYSGFNSNNGFGNGAYRHPRGHNDHRQFDSPYRANNIGGFAPRVGNQNFGPYGGRYPHNY